MAFLHLKGVCKSFGAAEILHNIELAAGEGEFLVLVGPSGCGKSTLLNLIAGLEGITAGKILLRDREINDLHPSARNMAMVFQSYALYPHMTVRQNLAFGLEMHGADKNTISREVADVAAQLQIETLLDRKPARLSGGQRQRVAMGRALVRKPDVFLLDEPLSNLDAKLRVEMRTMIKKLHRELGTTTVYVTHDQIEAMTLADRIAVMNAGSIQQLGPPREIYEQPANLFVAGFMGSPSMNLLDVKVSRDNNGLAVGFDLDNGESVLLPLRQAPSTLDAYVGGTCILGLRPEVITAAANTNPVPDALQYFENRIEVVEPTGSDTFLISRMAGTDVIARVPADTSIRPGETFRFSVNMDQILLFDPETGTRLN